MFLLIESEDQIFKAQRQLEATMRREFKRRAVKDIGYPGGSKRDAKVFTDGHHWYWSLDADADVSNPCRLNWFGLFKDKPGLGITVEINTPYEGRTDLVAGFFARDTETAKVYLMHSGRIGGGTKGVGKAAFLAWSDQRLIDTVDSSGEVREGVLVMPIEGVSASRSASRYIETIASFKRAVREGLIQRPDFVRKKKRWADFYSEGRGRRKGKRSGTFDYLSRHGEVVDALNLWRTAGKLRKHERIVKDILIDLGVQVAGDLTEVFEVKTSTARSDLYAGIGQLLVHGSSPKCRKIIVLPSTEPLAPDIKDALLRLNIEVLNFRLSREGAAICPVGKLGA
jgi:hypothetical protein